MHFEKSKKPVKVNIPGYGAVELNIELRQFSTLDEIYTFLDGEKGVFNVLVKAIHATQKQSARASGAAFGEKIPKDATEHEKWIATEVMPKLASVAKDAKPNTGAGGGLTGAEAKDRLSEIAKLDPSDPEYANKVAAILSA